ncbi:hypothetical protein L211DRAFT_845042 [Terfezia boudieri ATCC MYA-4762]|uniref:Uncharacterized protein n=1 Tax=Terfezia boudieri ATCC MYA-4762 TaxID=1051890 RepID=A0A3N4MLJ9_9PEZI|nr:hypothetical protein L211DRAFT_845042 [Terfezia boudieri ATCC MYA-4762]
MKRNKQEMRPISSSPMKGNTNSVQAMLTHDTSRASAGSDTTTFADATEAFTSRGRGGTLDTAMVETPRVRGRSQSPVKTLRSNLTQHSLDRNLFSNSLLRKSPSKGVINSDFTGRTFSERERAVELKAQGRDIPPLPSRTLAEVPWKKGRSKSREGFEPDAVDINIMPGNNIVLEATTIQEPPTLVIKNKSPPAPIQSAMGPDSDSSTSSTDTANIPRYEIIIWRTFPARKNHRDQEAPEQTRKCSFPITKKLARRLVNGQKADFITALNQFIATKETGIPITSDPSFTLQATVQSEGTSFPLELLDLAEQQFADIIDEIVSYQVQGYGRWSIDGMMRRVVIPEAGQLASLGPCLEALVVITLEACGSRWVGLPGFDADGNLKSISRADISEAKKSVDASTPHQDLPNSTTRLTSGSVAALKSTKKGNVTIPVPANFQRPPAANPSFPTETFSTVSETSKGVATTDSRPPKRSVTTVPVEQCSLSPDFADGGEESGDEDMSMINIESVQEVLKKGKTFQTTPIASRSNGINPFNSRLGLPGGRLSTSTTPFLTVRHHEHAGNFLASGAGIAATHGSESLITPVSKLTYYPRMSSSTSGDNISPTESNGIPKPKKAITEDPEITTATTTHGDQKTKAQSTLRRDVLVKGQFEASKPYISSRNPSNPLPGTLMSPGLFEQEPTPRMAFPTPPPNTSLPLATEIMDADTKATKPQRSRAEIIGVEFARQNIGTLESFKPGTFTSNLQALADRTHATKQQLPHPTKSLQNLAQAAAGETAVVRRRWEESTAASLRKERPPSPVKSQSNSTIKRADSPTKRSAQSIAAAANVARTVSLRTLRALGPRPKSRGDGVTGQGGRRTKDRVPSGAISKGGKGKRMED